MSGAGRPPLYLRDLRVGAVIAHGPVRYKILRKGDCSVRVLRTERVSTLDDTVMPPVDTVTERSTEVNIAPTARLADFNGWKGVARELHTPEA